jgi:hypothetical protein
MCCSTAKDPEEVCSMREEEKSIRDPGLILGDGGVHLRMLGLVRGGCPWIVAGRRRRNGL